MFRAPRGTHDVLPDDFAVRAHILRTASRIAHLAGYRGIETPIIEDANLFSRGVGDGTDIVEKEMYVFEDRGGDRLALRPEPTASICRAYLEHGMGNEPQPVKLSCYVQNFRYERPQAGRYRQFSQFGLEAIGSFDPALDAEVIEVGWRIGEELGLTGLTLLLNSIGDTVDRQAYVPELRSHFQPHLETMCADCQGRFARAPMRLLDCKKDSCRPFQEGAPHITHHLRPESAQYYEAVKGHLTDLQIPFEEHPSLVRGLDYYTHTVFEIVPAQAGSQVTVLAGGRYDGLIEQLGGPSIPGIGFGMGVERMALNLTQQELAPDPPPGLAVVVITLGDGAARPGGKLAADLRRAGIGATLAFGGRSMKAQMRHANRSGARVAVILGERELAAGNAELRDLAGSSQRTVALDAVVTEL
ncbi:MAG TPA: histidine--tRNA ligase, partial [Dehalococcoidia bacterium]|nr:histidine--tRNA ligase [Dehalococcoidia bacterium]